MRKPRAPQLVTVIIFTAITTILWIFYSIYIVLTGEAHVDIDPKLLEPVSPTLDTGVLERLPGRIFFDQGQTQPQQSNLVTPTPTQEVTPTPTITEESSLEESEVAEETPTPTP